jgi:hypothetical protein
MSARSEHLSEEAGLLVCYGKSYDEDDDDCSDCPLSGDCETLTELRSSQRKGVRVAKMPPIQPQRREEEEDEEEDERVPWAIPSEPSVPPTWAPPKSAAYPQVPMPQYADPRYMVPVPPAPMQPYVHPGLQNTAQIMPHPSPHLTYMVSNPIDCPMPVVDEGWYMRIAKNVLSGALSEGGRQFYEFFRRFRF